MIPETMGKPLPRKHVYNIIQYFIIVYTVIILSFPTQINISSTIVGLVDQSENLPATNMEYLARNTAKVTGDHHDHHPNWDVHQIF